MAASQACKCCFSKREFALLLVEGLDGRDMLEAALERGTWNILQAGSLTLTFYAFLLCKSLQEECYHLFEAIENAVEISWLVLCAAQHAFWLCGPRTGAAPGVIERAGEQADLPLSPSWRALMVLLGYPPPPRLPPRCCCHQERRSRSASFSCRQLSRVHLEWTLPR